MVTGQVAAWRSRPQSLVQRVQEIQAKLDERLREPGAIARGRAKRLADALSDLARAVNSM